MIRIDNLHKSYGTKTDLDHVSYHFPEHERIALVGANGAGKTTLLDILTEQTDIDGGTILKPSRLRLGYLPQEPSANPAPTVLEEVVSGGEGFMQALYRRHHQALEKMTHAYSDQAYAEFERVEGEFKREGGYSMESDARAVLTGLGFSPETIAKDPRALSGGWRMRLELAKIFVNRPNFLILDEPTNHLDLPSLVWVERWLQNFEGTLLFVSHDKSLLDRLPTLTLHLNLGNLTPYKGNFSAFLVERELRQEQEVATAESLRRRREHLQSFVDRFGAKATKAAQAQSRVKMIAKIRDLEDAVNIEEDIGTMAFNLPEAPPSGREVLKIKGGAIGYATTLASGINLLVEKGQRIAVIGANGIGKSTLLKTIAGAVQAHAGTFELGYNVKMSWFAQDQLDTLNPKKTVLANVLEASAEATEREARAVLGSLLFRGDDVFKNVGVLSGGEKARVGLSRLLTQRSNFLLMDEPTNHLDLSSVEILSGALSEYTGTLLFVSHDRNFIDEVCSHVFVMLPDGRSQLFAGKLEDYQRMAKQSGFPDVLDPSPVSSLAPATQKKEAVADKKPSDGGVDYSSLKRDLQKCERRVAELDKAIAQLNKDIESKAHEMESVHGNFAKLSELAQVKEEAEMKLATLEEAWLEVSGRAEEIREKLSEQGRK